MESLDPKWIRVSSVLSIIPEKSPDGKWRYPLNDINPEVLSNKASLGTEVHAAISAHFSGDFYVLTEKEEAYFKSFLKWAIEVKIAQKKSELRLFYEPMLLTGCVDMLAEIDGSSTVQLIDFKCTASKDLKKWKIQAALYYFLCEANNIKVDNRALFVQLDAKGQLPVVHEINVTKELSSAAISFYNAYMYLTVN